MEMETIDLTDPLQEFLRRTGWSHEEVLERLEKLKEDSQKTRNLERNSQSADCMSRSEYGVDGLRKAHLEEMETIELSDDETEQITNVVIEIEDDDVDKSGWYCTKNVHDIDSLCENVSENVIKEIETSQDIDNLEQKLRHEYIFQEDGDDKEESNTGVVTKLKPPAVTDTSQDCSQEKSSLSRNEVTETDISHHLVVSDIRASNQRNEEKTNANHKHSIENNPSSAICQTTELMNWESVEDNQKDGTANDDHTKHQNIEASDPELSPSQEDKHIENTVTIEHTVFNGFGDHGLGLLISSVRGGVEFDETDDQAAVTPKEKLSSTIQETAELGNCESIANALANNHLSLLISSVRGGVKLEETDENTTVTDVDVAEIHKTHDDRLSKRTNDNKESTNDHQGTCGEDGLAQEKCESSKDNFGFTRQETPDLKNWEFMDNKPENRMPVDDYEEHENSEETDLQSSLLMVEVLQTTTAVEHSVVSNNDFGKHDLGLLISSVKSGIKLGETGKQSTLIDTSKPILEISKVDLDLKNSPPSKFPSSPKMLQHIPEQKTLLSPKETLELLSGERTELENYKSIGNEYLDRKTVGRKEHKNGETCLESLGCTVTPYKISKDTNEDRLAGSFSCSNVTSLPPSLTNKLIILPEDFPDVKKETDLKNIKNIPNKHLETGDTVNCTFKCQEVEPGYLKLKENEERVDDPDSSLLAVGSDNTFDQNSGMIVIKRRKEARQPSNEEQQTLNDALITKFGSNGKPHLRQPNDFRMPHPSVPTTRSNDECSTLTSSVSEDEWLVMPDKETATTKQDVEKSLSASSNEHLLSIKETNSLRCPDQSKPGNTQETIRTQATIKLANSPQLITEMRKNEFIKCAASEINLDRLRKDLKLRLNGVLLPETPSQLVGDVSLNEGESRDVDSGSIAISKAKPSDPHNQIEDNFGITSVAEDKETHTALTKDICCTNAEETASLKSVGSEEEENETKLSFEEIRKNLKMQLTSLRTRKNLGVLPVLPDNEHQLGNIFKKKLLDDDEGFLQRKLFTTSVCADDKPAVDGDRKTRSHELVDSIKSVSLSTPSNKVTTTSIDVVADTEQSPEAKTDKVDEENLNESANDGIPNVLNEIRKIINKQKASVTSGISESVKPPVFQPTAERIGLDSGEKIRETNSGNDQKTDSKNDGNSPFVSDSLDEFLTENSKLNVSYVVPKSGAEEGLRKNYAEEPVVPISVSAGPVKEEHSERSKLEMPKFKAKTLAEKRKMFERNKRRELKELKRMKKISDEQERSYVLYENKKIWVKSEAKSKCFAEIDSDRVQRSSSKMTPRKLSLLDEFKRRKHEVKYKAGPLCKKPELQEEDDTWESEVKTLPKITLEIQPQTGKPIWPGVLHLLPSYDGEVTEDQIDFALTALVTNRGESDIKKFKFDVPYANNQEKILTKKRVDPASIPKSRLDLQENKDISSEKQVASVIEDLLKFVELKEIAPSLIKEDEDRSGIEDVSMKEEPNDGHLLVKRKRAKKRSRTDLELNRLSCKIVSVDVEDSPNEACGKPYCALGCVCISLACETFIGMHCRKVDCMFGCNCPEDKGLSLYHEKIKLPVGSNVLSTDTVSRIEDAAKKNLAKVEREFTQTVIHTSNKTIIVGSNKPRRATRTPKKYTDFFDESDDDSKAEVKSAAKSSHQMMPCTVEVQKFNFSDLTPFCIVHNLHDCHCNLTGTFPIDEVISTVRDPLDLTDCLVTSENPTVVQKRNNRSLHKKPTRYIDAEDHALPPKVAKVEPPEPSNCARTNVAKYRKSRRLLETVFDNDFIRNITEADLLKAQLSGKKRLTECESLKLALLDHEQKKTEEIERKNKRKQLLEVREECQNDLPNTDEVVQANKTCRAVFDGEIIVNDQEWIEKFGQTAKQHVGSYARILPWKALLEGYLSKKIRVYCLTNSPYKLIITKSGRVVRNALNVDTHAALILSLKVKSPWLVSQCDNVKDIVRWLMTCTLPEKYSGTSLSILLVETHKNMFEVKGLCTQNLSSALGKPGDESADAQLVKHRDMHNDVKTLNLIKERFPLQELLPEKEDFLNSSEEMYLWVGLPKVHDFCKWRVVPLNGDFAYLHFKKVNYSVKYTDLVKFSEMAKEAQCTLVIRNEQIANGHSHSEFGLYIDQSYSDRVFVGPYFKQCQEEDVETLRYINGSLVSCECFNKMRGNTSYQCGTWMTERVHKAPRRYVKATIDLTADDDAVEIDDNAKQETIRKAPDFQQVIFHNNIAIHIKNAKPKSPSDYNRYILTNIPRFGYLGAYQPDNSHVLEVSWPFEKKVLQFENADHARDFLKERFNQLLQPVPETFEIQVIVLVELDLNEYKPINSDFLSGHCICGYFGTYNFRELSEDFCNNVLKISKEEITKMFAKRAQAYVRKRVDELALVIGMKQENVPNCTLDFVLDAALNLIKTLDDTKKKQITTIKNLEKSVMEKIKVLYELMHNLPPKERNIESQVFKEILKIRPDRFISRETVEIEDDDAGSFNAQSDSNVITIPVSSHTQNKFADCTDNQRKANTHMIGIGTSGEKQNSGNSFKLLNPRAMTSVVAQARNIKVAKVAPFQTASTSGQSSVLRPLLPKAPILTPVHQKINASQTVSDASVIPSWSDVNPPGQEPPPSPLAHTLGVVSPKGTLVKGMKVLKTREGKFLLVTKSMKALPGPHKRVIIKNNKVYRQTVGDLGAHPVGN
ncbi:uncharacterized protein LOC132705657 [Cylas formicarius]|uniref:uncharacterized protein LOC132705657 n=1 Tax=Cylas formicarius TaxID=197179 RepID=UPI00295891B5|nr:uncharacterized protein LOC132705657 [Cylas formicarius]